MSAVDVALSVGDFEGVKAAAEAAVDVPQSVVDLIVDLRSHLQDKCEPPVYVSDRRLVKSIALLRVVRAQVQRRNRGLVPLDPVNLV